MSAKNIEWSNNEKLRPIYKNANFQIQEIWKTKEHFKKDKEMISHLRSCKANQLRCKHL